MCAARHVSPSGEMQLFIQIEINEMMLKCHSIHVLQLSLWRALMSYHGQIRSCVSDEFLPLHHITPVNVMVDIRRTCYILEMNRQFQN